MADHFPQSELLLSVPTRRSSCPLRIAGHPHGAQRDTRQPCEVGFLMNLRTATLFAAIAQTIALAINIVNFAYENSTMRFSLNWRFVIVDVAYWLVDLALIVFFFTLYARQKSS